jgi:hypothetical protein
MNSASGLVVRGGATAEELGAVIAVLARHGGAEEPLNGYERWRSGRRQALSTGPSTGFARPRVRTTQHA